MKKTIRMVVAGMNSDGQPDVVRITVEAKAKEIERGAHYNTAKEAAEGLGLDPMWAADESDPGFGMGDWIDSQARKDGLALLDLAEMIGTSANVPMDAKVALCRQARDLALRAMAEPLLRAAGITVPPLR